MPIPGPYIELNIKFRIQNKISDCGTEYLSAYSIIHSSLLLCNRSPMFSCLAQRLRSWESVPTEMEGRVLCGFSVQSPKRVKAFPFSLLPNPATWKAYVIAGQLTVSWIIRALSRDGRFWDRRSLGLWHHRVMMPAYLVADYFYTW